jgi:hypothetical protein
MMTSGLIRTRWAAIGAAVAVSFGGGAVAIIAHAAGQAAPSSLVTMVPCRLMDTRPATNVGPRATPLGPNDTYVVTVRGDNGNCSVPSSAVAVSMNVTAVNATAGSFLTVFPADAPSRPVASSLNYEAGQAPTPNSVTVQLSSDGKIAFYNLAGNVEVIADIVGYYEPSVTGPAGAAGPAGPSGPAGAQGIQGPVGPLPTVLIASLTSCCVSLANPAIGEANAIQVLIKGTPSPGKYLARVDAELNNLAALFYDYHCKLQSLAYPALVGTPFSDIPGTRRDVSWRTGKDNAGSGSTAYGLPISMQAPVTAGPFGVDIRMVCWGTIDGSPVSLGYGLGVESAVLTVEPVGAFG